MKQTVLRKNPKLYSTRKLGVWGGSLRISGPKGPGRTDKSSISYEFTMVVAKHYDSLRVGRLAFTGEIRQEITKDE